MRQCPQCGIEQEDSRCPRCDVDTVALPVAEDDPLVGREFAGRFRVERLIGQGGMGAVYEAEQLSMQRPVALKVMLASSADVDAVKRFYREAQASSRLEHPNTIRVFDFGTDEGNRQFLAMELLNGESLGTVLQREEHLTPERTRHIAVQIAKALGAAHAEGLVHRDLKPDNVFLCDLYGEPDFVKVLDFGIARFTRAEEVSSALTGAGMTIGTADYMSPEQVVGAELDGRSDLYSLGVLLYRCLTGRLPFPAAKDAGAMAAAIARCHGEPAPLDCPDCPADLSGVVADLLREDVNERPADARAVIERLASGSGPLAAPTSEEALAATRLLDASDDPARPFSWKKLVAALGALAVAAALVVLLWPASTGGGARQSSGAEAPRTAALKPRAPSAPAPAPAPEAGEDAGGPSEAGDDAGATEPAPEPVPEMRMVLVPEGRFTRGSREGVGDADEHPAKKVRVSAFRIDEREVTAGEFARCVAAGACSPTHHETRKFKYCNLSQPETAGRPMNCVDRTGAAQYCAFVGKRLPTEAEWEKAARGEDERLFPWGDAPPACGVSAVFRSDTTVSSQGCGERRSFSVTESPRPAGASPCGAVDMAGNLAEWVSDAYDPDYYARQTRRDPTGPGDGEQGVVRGGSFRSPSPELRVSDRRAERPEGRFRQVVGFRCVAPVE